MLKVKGTYEGGRIVLVEPLPVPPQTTVEVLVPHANGDGEREYWRRLSEAGLVLETRSCQMARKDFTPIAISGEPLSAT